MLKQDEWIGFAIKGDTEYRFSCKTRERLNRKIAELRQSGYSSVAVWLHLETKNKIKIEK